VRVDNPVKDEPHSVLDAQILIVDDLMQVFATTPPPGDAGSDIPLGVWKEILEKPAVWVVSNEDDVPAWQNWIEDHKPAPMELNPVALDPVQSLSVTGQYSILKLQWQGLFHFLGLAIPIALAAAAIWALYWDTIPNSAFLRFAGFGLAAAFIAEIVLTFFLSRAAD
jgi:hypothetical protein